MVISRTKNAWRLMGTPKQIFICFIHGLLQKGLIVSRRQLLLIVHFFCSFNASLFTGDLTQLTLHITLIWAHKCPNEWCCTDINISIQMNGFLHWFINIHIHIHIHIYWSYQCCLDTGVLEMGWTYQCCFYMYDIYIWSVLCAQMLEIH